MLRNLTNDEFRKKRSQATFEQDQGMTGLGTGGDGRRVVPVETVRSGLLCKALDMCACLPAYIAECSRGAELVWNFYLGCAGTTMLAFSQHSPPT